MFLQNFLMGTRLSKITEKTQPYCIDYCMIFLSIVSWPIIQIQTQTKRRKLVSDSGSVTGQWLVSDSGSEAIA